MAQRVAGLTIASLPRRSIVREAIWLKARYEDTKWLVIDTVGEGEPVVIDFFVKLPNGKMLTEEPEWYATAKEFVYWLREGNYTKIHDARTHADYALAIMQIIYGLVARGHKSMAKILADDVDEICEASKYGKDGVTSASMILRRALEAIASWEEAPPNYVINREFDLFRLIEDLNLPPTWGRAPLRQEVNFATARLNGKSLVRAGPKTVTARQVNLITSVFEGLFYLRHHMKAPSIAFRPFEEGATRRAITLGVTTEPVPIAPPDLAIRFISRCANYIQKHATEVSDRFKARWATRVTEHWTKGKTHELRTQMHRIGAAAFVLIAAFTARRLREILKLKRDCLRCDDTGSWWLNVYIEKSERRWTWTPIPKIVAKAVECLLALGEAEAKEDGLLFHMNSLRYGRVVKPIFHRKIKDLARHLDSEAYVDSDGHQRRWIWEPRQFRRFFAVMFIYRFHGQKETLAHHLRHYDLETANDYLQLDPETSSIWLKEMANFRVHVATRIARGDNDFVGAMGDRLKKLAQRLRRMFEERVKLVPEKMAGVILKAMSKHHLVLKPKAWATCTCPQAETGARRAACRRVGGAASGEIGPDFESAAPSVCPGCPWALISQANVEYMSVEIEELERSAAQASGAFAELAMAEVIILSKYRESLNVWKPNESETSGSEPRTEDIEPDRSGRTVA
ncbi:hypothetical protein GOD83_06825 [Sinorhizobium medicae]|nr:hypothetical protein [Sinorhizobium medicae]MDX0578220.1 hypothetical protein [Sinorhizobium medicae]MDX0780068.1 hypothetical protein [Sinorhizobium medicae]